MNIYWISFSEFLFMGGYGFYVWGSFSVMILLMTLEPVLVARERRKLQIRLSRQFRAEMKVEKRNDDALTSQKGNR